MGWARGISVEIGACASVHPRIRSAPKRGCVGEGFRFAGVSPSAQRSAPSGPSLSLVRCPRACAQGTNQRSFLGLGSHPRSRGLGSRSGWAFGYTKHAQHHRVSGRRLVPYLRAKRAQWGAATKRSEERGAERVARGGAGGRANARMAAREDKKKTTPRIRRVCVKHAHGGRSLAGRRDARGKTLLVLMVSGLGALEPSRGCIWIARSGCPAKALSRITRGIYKGKSSSRRHVEVLGTVLEILEVCERISRDALCMLHALAADLKKPGAKGAFGYRFRRRGRAFDARCVARRGSRGRGSPR